MRKRNHLVRAAGAVLALLAIPEPAAAAEADQIQIEPIIDARLRYETVDPATLDADAVTLRLRAGAEAKLGNFSLLAEIEGTLAPVNDYNAFPFAIADEQRRQQYAVVSDPRNTELNRL